MTVLLTGFEPFGGEQLNPSWEAVRRLPDHIGAHTLHRLRLPVVFGRCGHLLAEEVRALRPEVVIACGVAGKREEITPELAALNWRMADIPDNSGRSYDGQPIDPSGPDAYMTRLPVTAMVRALRRQGIPARLSLSAGSYVCNDLYYALMAGQAQGGYRGLFIHVPPLTVLSAEETARALGLCLEAL